MNLGKIIDLSMPIEKGMRMFPGIPEPTFTRVRTHEEHGLQVTKIELVVHSGTHVDSPRHVINNRETIEQTHLDRLIGEAKVLDFRYKWPGEVLTEEDFIMCGSDVQENDIVILNTGYEGYTNAEKYCTISADAALWLVKHKIKCLAVDMPSLDPLNRTGSRASDLTHPSHHIILGAGIPLIELLINLDSLSKQVFLICLPLKISACEAAPARVVAAQLDEP